MIKMPFLLSKLIRNLFYFIIFLLAGINFVLVYETLWSALLSLIIVGLAASHYYHDYVNSLKIERYLKQFTYIPEINSYEESKPRLPNIPNKPFKQAVLFLHGWSGSPGQLDCAIPYFEEANIAYFAPQLTGFGLGDTHLLNDIRASDWIRDALYAYDALSHISKEVNIVGHSNGACLALIVAQYRRIDKILLTSPNFIAHKRHKVIRRFLLFPITGRLLRWAIPVFFKGKASDLSDDGKVIFHYPALPISSLVALWEVQGLIKLNKTKFKSLSVFLGKNDKDIDSEKALKFLNKHKIEYNKVVYEHSDHNLLQGKEKDKIARDILHFLNGGSGNYTMGTVSDSATSISDSSDSLLADATPPASK